MNRDIKTGYDNSGGQIGLSPSQESSVAIPVPLHPEKLKEPPVTMPSDPLEALETFEKRLTGTLNHDYGDWMREANKAWHELYQILAPHSPVVERQLQDMHDFIQYRPSWEPVHTCRMALLLAREIQRELGGPSGDIDFHRFSIGWTEPETEMAYFELASPFPDQHVPAYPPTAKEL